MIDAAIARVLSSGWYILGKEVRAFEEEFAAFLGVRHVIGVGSGTDALHLALRVCDVGAGDEVITVSHTAVATVAAIELAGAAPVFVDIDPITYTLDPIELAKAIKCHHRVKAVIPVHLYGHPAAMPEISELVRTNGLVMIEDCAQSHGAKIGERMTGAWGDFGAFSFYPTKNLGAIGDGGALATDNSLFAERARALREYGWRERYVSEMAGMNTRLDELQAAILRAKLPTLPIGNARRAELAMRYDVKLSGTALSLPQRPGNGNHVFHQYVVRTTYRDALRECLKNNGINALIHYPMPVHLQPAYRGRVSTGDLPVTECAAREVLSLPMFPELSQEQADWIIEVILGWDRMRQG
jgi:dTDP-4-amino-4,6-dideoxygalactose transaminase